MYNVLLSLPYAYCLPRPKNFYHLRVLCMSLGIVEIVTLQNAYVREVLKLQKLSVNSFFCSSHRAQNYITLHLPFRMSSMSV